MIKKLIHFSDLHIRLFKDHDLYKSILEMAIEQWRELNPDRIVFTGDLVHSKNQMTPELIEMVRWLLTECSFVAKTIIIPGNHDFLVNNTERLDALTPIISSLNSKNIVYYKDRGVYEDENIRLYCKERREFYKMIGTTDNPMFAGTFEAMNLPKCFAHEISSKWFNNRPWELIKMDKKDKILFYAIVNQFYSDFVCHPSGKIPLPYNPIVPTK